MSISRLDGTTEAGLLDVVRRHYEPMMGVRGEINFDLRLGQAEVDLAVKVYGEALPSVAYLPCCGALRHAPALLAAGVKHLFAVDLSLECLRAGMDRNVAGTDHDRMSVCHADVRYARALLPERGVEFAFLGGNSVGDVTNLAGHLAFIAALADALAPGGTLVFDYVADRYVPAADRASTEWPEIFDADGASMAVLDRRARTTKSVPGTALSVLTVTCEVIHARTGEHLVDSHAYSKLIVPDAALVEQFADAGMELVNVGRVVDLSPYHRERVRDIADLGMLGTPNCYYRATKH